MKSPAVAGPGPSSRTAATSATSRLDKSVPLVFAHGAAQISRRDVGTSVFSGMLVASSIGVFLIPMLYVVFQRWRERDFRSRRGGPGKLAGPARPAGD